MPNTQINGATPPEFDWTGIVSQSVDAWPEPPTLPAGHYQLRVRGGKFDKSKGSTFIGLSPVQPLADVDVAEIEALGDITQSMVFVRFNMARYDDVARLKQLIRAIGLGEYNIDDALKAMKDTVLQGEVTHSPKDDGTDGKWVNVRRLGPVVA